MDEEQKRLAEELLFSGDKLPGFAKLLYFGVLDADRVCPFPKISNDEKRRLEELIEQFERFADEKIDPDRIDREAKIPDEVIQGLADLGIFGATVPEKYGGMGLSQSAYCKLMERVAMRCASTALFINVQHSIGLRALLLFGTEDQKKTWLAPLAKGEKFAAFSLTEPNAGSDASGVETKAVYNPEKKCYVLNGIKQWTSNGSIADVLTVMAKTDVEGREKVTAFLVNPTMKGFRVRDKALEKVGMRGTWTANLAFDDMEVPEENILGPIGGGLKVALTVLDYGRVTFGATCTGAAKFCQREALEHAKTRIQFKRPLASFPMVKRMLVRMFAYTYAMDAATYLTAGLLDGDDHDIMIESAVIKVFNSESLWKTLYDTMQIFGGRSFFTDHPFERMMRDARLNSIGEGSNEVLQAFIGVVGMREVGVQLKEGLEALKNPFSDYKNFFKMIKSFYYRTYSPKIPLQSAELKEEGKRLGEAIRRLGIAVLKALSKHREEIVEKQLILDRIAIAVTSIYTAIAVLSKVDSEIHEGDRSNLKLVKWYCKDAIDGLHRALDSLLDPHDEELEKLANEIYQSQGES